jgi:uncharacterized protein
MLQAIDASVAVFARGLTNLRVLLRKGEAHAASTGTDPASLLGAQLADGMYDLAVQAHWACEGTRLAVARLLGVVVVPRAEEGRTFAALCEHIDVTLEQLATVAPEALEAGLGRTIELAHRGRTQTFRGDRFLTEYAIPSFFFHLTLAYAILRHAGVPLQKGDFLGA